MHRRERESGKFRIFSGRSISNLTEGDIVHNTRMALPTRVILISLFLRYPILHAPTFCHLPQGFQNCFCFCSTTFPSHVGTFFRLQWESQWEI